MPFFSIIIPVYNVAPYLRECLDSVLAQTFTDWEAICIDDGSTDGSGAILDEYAARDSRFRIIHQPNAGVSVARNKGLDVAKGEWIWFVDSDDMIKPHALDRFYNLECKADITYFGMDFLLQDGSVSSFHHVRILPTKLDDESSAIVERFASSLMGIDFFGYTVNKFIRRSIIQDNAIRFEPGINCWEDALFFIKVFADSSTFAVISDSLYSYRQLQTGLTNSGNKPMLKIGQLFEEYGKSSRLRGLRRFAFRRALTCYRCAISQKGDAIKAARRILILYRHEREIFANGGMFVKTVSMLSHLPLSVGSVGVLAFEWIKTRC